MFVYCAGEMDPSEINKIIGSGLSSGQANGLYRSSGSEGRLSVHSTSERTWEHYVLTNSYLILCMCIFVKICMCVRTQMILLIYVKALDISFILSAIFSWHYIIPVVHWLSLLLFKRLFYCLLFSSFLMVAHIWKVVFLLQFFLSFRLLSLFPMHKLVTFSSYSIYIYADVACFLSGLMLLQNVVYTCIYLQKCGM